MPQMAPMNWLSLYFLFLFLFLIMVMMNYFSFLYKPKNFMKTYKTRNINWKW